MALSKSVLESEFLNIFTTMNDIHKNGEEYMATECAKAIYNYIALGVVNTVDGGTGTVGGVYAGKGTGKMLISSTTLGTLLLSTFLTAKNDNDTIATLMASNIHSVCSAENTIATTTSGETTTAEGTVVDGGSGVGSFNGNYMLIANKLKSCFATMKHMKVGGNAYFAQEFADVIHSYMTSGTVTITLNSPLKGKGKGTIS